MTPIDALKSALAAAQEINELLVEANPDGDHCLTVLQEEASILMGRIARIVRRMENPPGSKGVMPTS